MTDDTFCFSRSSEGDILAVGSGISQLCGLGQARPVSVSQFPRL